MTTIPGRVWAIGLVGVLVPMLSPAMSAAEEARLVGKAGKCLSVEGAPQAGSRVILETCRDSLKQVWQLPDAGFAGEIRTGGLCLDIQNAQTDDFTPIQLFGCHGAGNQRWYHDGTGRLVGLGGRCLDIAHDLSDDGTPAILFGCHGEDNQRFLALPEDGWARTHFHREDSIGPLMATRDPSVVYLGPTPILRSGDGGATWASVKNADLTSHALVDPLDENRLWTIDYDGKLERSDDGGRSWRVQAGIAEPVVAFAASQQVPGRILAVAGGKVWRIDAPDTPATLVGTVETGLPANGLRSFAEDRRGRWLASYLDPCDSFTARCVLKLFRRDAPGQAWHEIFGLPDVALYDPPPVLAHPAEDSVYVLSGYQIYRSVNGAAFVPAGVVASHPGIYGERTKLIGDPRRSYRLWAIKEGQVSMSDDRGSTWWRPLPDAGARGPWRARGLVFPEAERGGDRVLVVSPSGGGILSAISEDGGATFALSSADGVAGGALGGLVAGSWPGLYYGGGGGWRTQDHGRTWEQLANDRYEFSLLADPVRPQVFYTFRLPGLDFRRSRDGGVSLETLQPPFGSLRDLVVARQGSGSLLVALESNNFGHLYTSRDEGETWQRLQVDNAPLSDLASDGRAIYAKSHTRMLVSLDGATWSVAPARPEFLQAGGGKWLGIVGQELWVGTPGTVLSKVPVPRGFAAHQFRLDAWGRLYGAIGRATFRSHDNGAHWHSIELAGDRHLDQVVADPFDPTLLMGSAGAGPMIGRFRDPALVAVGSGRFTVSVRWRNGDGPWTPASGDLLTDDSATFRLFDAERAELLVKVLDGRAVNGRFWVFVGSLTSVEVEVEVKDRISGESRLYEASGPELASFGDTDAFPAERAEVSGAAPRLVNFTPFPGAASVVLGGRFQLDADWQTAAGSSFATVARLGDDSAAFSFFSPDNPELMVNVIDGRAFNGRFWVFVASTTNAGFNLRIRDQTTGQVRTWVNPIGTFASFADVEAF